MTPVVLPGPEPAWNDPSARRGVTAVLNRRKSTLTLSALLAILALAIPLAAGAVSLYSRFVVAEQRAESLRDVPERLGRIEGKLDLALDRWGK